MHALVPCCVLMSSAHQRASSSRRHSPPACDAVTQARGKCGGGRRCVRYEVACFHKQDDGGTHVDVLLAAIERSMLWPVARPARPHVNNLHRLDYIQGMPGV